MKKYLVEFIGTFFLVFTVCMAGTFAGNLAPLAIGSALMIMVYAGGHISGGHYNPAVTTAVYIRGGNIELKDALMYMVFQILAAIVAAGLAWWFIGHAAVVAPSHFYSKWMKLAAEMLGTFALAYVVLNSATHPKTSGNSFYGLAIGFTVMTMAFAVGGVSGGAFNPAVGIGPNVMQMITGDMSAWHHIILYIVGPILGGAIAGYTYKFINAE
jgi:aquaporin Z